jgi:hypothetical protein
MRIAISALLGMTVALGGANALAQGAPEPGAPPADAQPTELPPPPPPPGAPESSEPPTAVPSPFSPEGESPDERMDQVGFRVGQGFFLRDSRDRFRLYPHGMVALDVYGSAGKGVADPTLPELTDGLKPRLLMRRARIGFEGEILKRWSFSAVLEFGAQTAANGAQSGKEGGRYAPPAGTTIGVTPLDVSIGYSVCKCLNFQVGHFIVPFSMDNRTGMLYYPLLERSLGIRAFAVPSVRDLGGMIWGDLGPHVFHYELGVFGGDGTARPSVDARADFIGRMYVRPFAGGATRDLAKYTQIGVSARHGDRDPKSVGYDYSPITTSQGFVLWKPTYTDSLGRVTHIIPSGSQNAIGGEFRTQVWRFALQGEAYYVVNNTREAVDGHQLDSTERLGRMKGVGWTAQLSAWPAGDAFIQPEPGVSQPRHVDLRAKDNPKVPHGLELIAQVSGINANYKASTRMGSKDDENTPSGDINIYQIGAGATYWHSRHVRVGVYYTAYLTPKSGTDKNLAVVPDNLKLDDKGKAGTGHTLHELSGRVAVAF